MSHSTDLAARRALLLVQWELDRIEVALAWHDLRRALRPDPDPLRAAGGRHPWLGQALGLVLPLLGATRARRLSRYVSFALLAYRIATGWHARGR